MKLTILYLSKATVGALRLLKSGDAGGSEIFGGLRLFDVC
jgi:hypothetical protein